jgi:exodeoxyribonuclease VII small subunit
MTEPTESLTYLQASEELRQIVDGLQKAQDIDVDDLMAQVDRAKQLIDFCGAKIKRAEVHVSSVLDELQPDEPEVAVPF